MTVEDAVYVLGIKVLEIEQLKFDLNATRKNNEDLAKQLAEEIAKHGDASAKPSETEVKKVDLKLVPKEEKKDEQKGVA